jgi:O-antigen ligase
VVLLVISYGLILDPGVGIAQSMGRDATLTGRTALWNVALAHAGNPLVGVGYESFWMGERLLSIWQVNWEHPNQAHNGYLEVFLDLGWVGIAFLALVMLRGYSGLARTFREEPEASGLRLAFFVVAAVYNLTEHAFRELHPVWIAFLFAVTVVPTRRRGRA